MAKILSETKEKPVTVSFTKTFNKMLEEAAEHQGITVTEFVRNATIEKMERLNGIQRSKG